QSKDGREKLRSESKLPTIPYYGTWNQRLAIKIPAKLPTGDYRISGKILSASRLISENYAELFIAGKNWSQQGGPLDEVVAIYDPSGKTKSALRKLGISSADWPG